MAASSEGAPVSALVWWIIPFLALIGGIGYAYWITKWKSRFENRTHRSIGNFRRFQESFKDSKESPTKRESVKKDLDSDRN